MAELFTEAFTNSDGTLLENHGNYASVTGSMDIQSNGLAGNSASAESAYRRTGLTGLDTDHQYIEYTLPAAGVMASWDTSRYIGGAVRMSSSAVDYVGVYTQYNGNTFMFYVIGGSQTVFTSANPYSALVSGGETIRVEANGTGANSLLLYIDGVLQDGTGGTPDLRQSIPAGLANGEIGFCAYHDPTTNPAYIESASGGDFTAAGAAIDTIDSPVLDAEEDNAFTVSGYGSAITSFTIEDVENGSHQIDLSASLAGTYTFDMPDVAAYTVDTVGTPFDSTYWSHTATAGDGTDTDTEVIVVNPKSGWARVDTATTPDVAAGSVYENFTGFFDAVSAVSVANPSQLTVADTSAWVTGQEVTLAGFTTTPDINGTQVITVVDSTHVSIPVNVTAVTDGVGTMLTGAASEHGQVYYPTANNTSVATDGTLTTDQIVGSISMQYFDTVDSKWKPFTVTISSSGTSTWFNRNKSKVIGYINPNKRFTDKH